MTLAWCHCPPADTPTRPCPKIISGEHQVDAVAPASYGRWQGGANTLVSDHNATIRAIIIVGAATLLHQGCPIAVRDCQVVVETDGIRFDVKCSEL